MSTRRRLQPCPALRSAVVCSIMIWLVSLGSVPASDVVADRVFGVPDFFTAGTCDSPTPTNLCNPIGIDADSAGNFYIADWGYGRVLVFMSPLTTDLVADLVIGPTSEEFPFFAGGPRDVAVDAAGNLYVADFIFNRVLEYDSPLTTDLHPDRVFGQPDFSTFSSCGETPNALCMSSPSSVDLDEHGNLYVGEWAGNRVLIFGDPLTSDTVADRVIGQPDFNTNSCNTGGVSALSLCGVLHMAVGRAGNLYVSDYSNARVLIYVDPLGSDRAADGVLGQPGFADADCRFPPEGLCGPLGVATDDHGNVYVGDEFWNAVLVFREPLSTDQVADEIFGQESFSSFGDCSLERGASGLCTPFDMAFDLGGNLFVSDLNNNRVMEYDGVSVDADGDGVVALFDLCPAEIPVGGDLAQDGCTDSLPTLRAFVQGLELPSKVSEGLLGKLDEAQKALDLGRSAVAIRKLGDFNKQVEGQRGKSISESVADLLVTWANKLITQLSG